MVIINGVTPKLVTINGKVPAVVKINNKTVWEDAFSIDCKANFNWDSKLVSSGCSDTWIDVIYLQDFEITARHYFPHLYLNSIEFSVNDFKQTLNFPDGAELKSGQAFDTGNLSFYTDVENNVIKADFYFYAGGSCKICWEFSCSFKADGRGEREDGTFYRSARYSHTISGIVEYENNIINAK